MANFNIRNILKNSLNRVEYLCGNNSVFQKVLIPKRKAVGFTLFPII